MWNLLDFQLARPVCGKLAAFHMERSPQQFGGENLVSQESCSCYFNLAVVPPCEDWHFHCQDSACNLQVFNFVLVS